MQLKIPSCILKNTTESFYKKHILNVLHSYYFWFWSHWVSSFNTLESKWAQKYGFVLVLLCLDQVTSWINWLLWPAKQNFNCNWTRTQNHLVLKRTLNHLVKLAKWLSCVLSTYLYGAFDGMFLSCHVHVSEWIHTQ